MKSWLLWTFKKSDHRVTKVRPKKRVMFFDYLGFSFCFVFVFNPFTFCFYWRLGLGKNHHSICWRYKLVFYEPVRIGISRRYRVENGLEIVGLDITFTSETTSRFLGHWVVR